VVVPVLVVELDEPHAALGQAACEQAVGGERAVARPAAVELERLAALAAEVLAKGAWTFNPRGERYSVQTIRGLIAMRDFMATMRASGVVGDGPPRLTLADRNRFASQPDRWLASRIVRKASQNVPPSD